jgi:hypothetical protein
MDVLNRKLFANKEARNKLAEMGGIMASSEALMREAQNVPMYAPGGVVNAPDLQKLRSDRSVRDSAERYGMEVDEYIGRMSDGEKRFIASKPKNEVGIDTAGAPDNELTNALATSRMGAKFADFLDGVGQTGIDVVSAALRKTGGTSIKMDARLGMAMAETAAFLGFPEQAAEWQTEAQKEMDYGNKMLDGDIGLFGQDRVGFQVPEEGKRLIEAARIAGKATEDVTSVRGPDGYLPESIIQARRMNPPSFDPDTPPDSLGYLSEGRGGDPFFDQQEMLLPGVDPASPTSAVPSPSTFSRTDRPVLGIPSTEMTPDGPVRRTDVMTRPAALEREGERLRSMGPLTAGGITDETGLSIAEQRANTDMMKAELDRQQEQQSAVDLIAAESMANQERMQMAGYEETRAKNKAREEDANRIKAEAMKAKALEAEKGPTSTTKEPVPVAAPEILATSVADAFAKLGDPAAASKAVLGKILADKAGPEGKEPPPSVDDMDIKTRVKTYENLFKEMFDEKDEDKTKEMYLNLAMIGFAVASGTSSNALTNISQGLMQGVTKMNEDRATRTARSDKVKMLALSESLTDERDDKSFDQQLQLAGIKNKGDRQEYLYKSVFETTYKTALEDDPENQQGALDQATRAAVSAAPEAPSALIAVKSTDNGTGGGTPTQKYAVGQVYKIGGKDYTYTGDRTKGNQGFVPN